MSKEERGEIFALDIGREINLLRKDRQFTLEDLSKKSGLSKPLLSQIENGLVIPPLTTLLKIAKALRVPLPYFFEENGRRVFLVRAEGMKATPKIIIEGRDPAKYSFNSLLDGKRSKNINPIYVEFAEIAEENTKSICHHGEEFVYVLEGQLEVRYDDKIEILEPGDSIYLDGRTPHTYRSLTKRRTKALMAVVE